MPVGLLHRAAFGPDRAKGAARRIGSQLVRLRVGMLVDLLGFEVEEFFVAGVLQHQCFLAVADDDPVALPDFELLHAIPLGSNHTAGGGRCLYRDRVAPGANTVGPIQLLAASSRRAMTCAWISAAPSKMLRMRASQRIRETGNSSAKPLPPWICTALSALAQATRAARSFAMPASRSQRL